MIRNLWRRRRAHWTAVKIGDRTARGESSAIDTDFYRRTYRSTLGCQDPVRHYFSEGAARGFLPSERFDPLAYAFTTPGVPPEHALAHARLVTGTLETDLSAIAGRLPSGTFPEPGMGLGHGVVLHEKDHEAVQRNRDAAPAYGRPYSVRLDRDAPGPGYWIEAPTPDAVWDTLRRDRPFTFVKLPHGLWDTYVAARNVARRLETLEDTALFAADQTERLARRLLGASVVERRGALLASDFFIDDVLDAISGLSASPGLSVGLAFTGYPVATGIAEHARDLFDTGDIRADLVRDAFPDGHRFLDGTLFKRWAISGDLSELPRATAGRPCVFILSDIFDGLGADLGLEDSHQVKVPPMASHFIRHEILDRTCELLAGLADRTRPPVVIAQVGGSLTFWLLTELRKRFPAGAFLDVGQSICIWRLAESRKLGWLRTYFDQVVANNDLATFYGAKRVTELREMIKPF